ncbi:MAG: hypothetical protein OHK0053_16540 [Microscillaceae bacterium]
MPSHHFSLCFFGLLGLGLFACPSNKPLPDKAGPEPSATLTNKEVKVVYAYCTVYAGSTQYFFKTETGDTIQVSVLNEALEEDGDAFPNPKVPNNLVDDSKDLEGVPGENPKMVGKPFLILYNEKDEIVAVKPRK